MYTVNVAVKHYGYEQKPLNLTEKNRLLKINPLPLADKTTAQPQGYNVFICIAKNYFKLISIFLEVFFFLQNAYTSM